MKIGHIDILDMYPFIRELELQSTKKVKGSENLTCTFIFRWEITWKSAIDRITTVPAEKASMVHRLSPSERLR